MSDSDMAYIGRSPCGHVNAATVDTPEHAKSTASTIASWIRRGMTIERMTVGDARPLIEFCDCEQKAKAEAKAAASQKKLGV